MHIVHNILLMRVTACEYIAYRRWLFKYGVQREPTQLLGEGEGGGANI